ncbi:MAG: TGS domain-containing protein, partial [Actinomycetospora chiangmaiensis]|nr:TGS domain-containing protein [Actinomycetospora chiangmaiensis]
MPILTFPNGDTREIAAGTTGRSVVEGLAKSLAKRTVAMALDGVLADLDDPIEGDARIEFLDRTDPRSLELIR